MIALFWDKLDTNTHNVLQDKHNCEYFFGMATWKQIVLVNKQK